MFELVYKLSLNNELSNQTMKVEVYITLNLQIIKITLSNR